MICTTGYTLSCASVESTTVAIAVTLFCDSAVVTVVQIGTVQTWVGTGTDEPPIHISTATLPNRQYRLMGNAGLNWVVQVALFEREGKMLKQVKCGLCAEDDRACVVRIYQCARSP